MVSFMQVKNGINKYLETELMTKVTGWQKWIVGSILSMYMEKATEVFNHMKTWPAVEALNIIDNNDMIDIDLIYSHLLAQAQHEAISFNLPMVGDITLRSEDVEKLYACIKSY